MLGAFRVRPSGHVKWKGREHQPDNAFDRSFRCRSRRHSPAERMPARKQWEIRRSLMRRRDRRSNCRDTRLRRIASAAFLGVREIVTERRDVLCGERVRDLLLRRVTHS